MRKTKNIQIYVLVLLVVAALVGRIIAHKSASNYGHTLKLALSTVGVASFADTSKLRNFFASPDMATSRRQLEALSFLGGDYSVRADELQRGIIYLSEQMALAPAQRFSAPLSMNHLTILSDDRTDDGIAAAASCLIDSYESQL